MSVFGTILILCGLIALIIVGNKARNLMIAGLGCGLAAWLFSWLNSNRRVSPWAGFGLCLSCVALFGWRSMTTLLVLIGIVQHEMPLDAYNKCITLVLLLIMCCASVSTLIVMYTFLSDPQKK